MHAGQLPRPSSPPPADGGAVRLPAPPIPSVPAAGQPASATPGGGARGGRQGAGGFAEVVITTGVLRLTFDTTGAQLVQAELLKYAGRQSRDQPTVLLDRHAGPALRGPVRRGGRGAQPGFPTHQTPFRMAILGNPA